MYTINEYVYVFGVQVVKDIEDIYSGHCKMFCFHITIEHEHRKLIFMSGDRKLNKKNNLP